MRQFPRITTTGTNVSSLRNKFSYWFDENIITMTYILIVDIYIYINDIYIFNWKTSINYSHKVST